MPQHHKITLTTLMIILFIGLLGFSGCVEQKMAYIPPDTIPPTWKEDTAARNTVIEFLGLEKWASITYEYQGTHKAAVSITTINTIVLTSEEELATYLNTTIQQFFQPPYTITITQTGSRQINLDHESQYIIYYAVNQTLNSQVFIIGETWNCGVSGVSILSLGFVYASLNETKNDIESIWQNIVSDPSGSIDTQTGSDGLLYNIKCH